MQKIIDQTFVGEVVLDDRHFIRCTFTSEAVMVFRGIKCPAFTDCKVAPTIGLAFEQHASETLDFFAIIWKMNPSWVVEALNKILPGVKIDSGTGKRN